MVVGCEVGWYVGGRDNFDKDNSFINACTSNMAQSLQTLAHLREGEDERAESPLRQQD